MHRNRIGIFRRGHPTQKLAAGKVQSLDPVASFAKAVLVHRIGHFRQYRVHVPDNAHLKGAVLANVIIRYIRNNECCIRVKEGRPSVTNERIERNTQREYRVGVPQFLCGAGEPVRRLAKVKRMRLVDRVDIAFFREEGDACRIDEIDESVRRTVPVNQPARNNYGGCPLWKAISTLGQSAPDRRLSARSIGTLSDRDNPDWHRQSCRTEYRRER